MAEYHVSTFTDGVPGDRANGIRHTFDAAARLFRDAVYEATEAQGLRDREAGWTAYRASISATMRDAPSATPKGWAARVCIAAKTVLIERVA